MLDSRIHLVDPILLGPHPLPALHDPRSIVSLDHQDRPLKLILDPVLMGWDTPIRPDDRDAGMPPWRREYGVQERQKSRSRLISPGCSIALLAPSNLESRNMPHQATGVAEKASLSD